MSLLPDIEGMLWRAVSKCFCSALDLKSAYKQIRIVPEHVKQSMVTTPDGNIVSQVIQMGDCNAPTTYQVLMNHLFSLYIGWFMDVYLDDIVIYSHLLDEYLKHVRIILDILEREKLYLSKGKMRFLVDELCDQSGYLNGPWQGWYCSKVEDPYESRPIIGSVKYLADDVPGVELPLSILSAITGDAILFH
jgi:Reverse transcriptase (RNA-dependent DNA polymerase)